jgi:acetyl-CoA C-acetyltransferase/acetyl-CoA acyltransferase
MRKVAVVGVGQTKFSVAQEKTGVELFSEAATDALEEVNLKPGDVQAMYVGNVLGDFAEGQCLIQAFAAENMGARNVPATRYEGACASSSVAIRDAFMWVASGFYDIVLAGGVERAATMGTSLATRTFAMSSDSRYEYPAGITFPAVFALLAHLYAAEYGIPLDRLREQLASVSIQSYKYGNLNPKSHFHGKYHNITVEDVLNSNMVSSPLTLHDCCPFSDGAAAVVLTSEETARRLTSKPVYITGIGQASAGAMASQQDYLPRIRARELSAKQAYDMAGLTPRDIDVCELHDCFSLASLIDAEGLGFFEFGKAGDAWERGEADIGGRVAINPSGGLKARGHPIGATGAAQVAEIVRQLRGDVEPGRQVEGARVGMTDTLGGEGGTLCAMIFQRGW